MKRFIFILLILIAMTNNTDAQTAVSKPCSAPECSQFDFWVGEWSLTYNDTVHAENRITIEMGGCLIHEHFHDPTNSYTGESWSVYNAQRKIWQQTWVDNQGGYIVLTGIFKDNKMVLYTEPATQTNGTLQQNRMVFYNITTGSFD